MNIAEKILRAKADLDSVYEAGVEKGRGEATDGVIVEPLEVDANGTYTAPNGVAYSPVKVNVPDVNGSYDEGYEDGYEKGKAEGAPEDLNDVLTAQEEKLAELSAILDTKVDGYDSGFEDGKKAEYDAFWDSLQNYGNRSNYTYFFRCCGNEYINTKYPIIDTQIYGIFAECPNLKGILCDVVPKDEYFTSLYIAFANSTLLEEINFDIPVKGEASAFNSTFVNCYKLKTIKKIILDGSQYSWVACFANCYVLENITFEGDIKAGTSSLLSFAQSNLLSNASVQSIIDHLFDYSGSTARTLQLHADVKARMTDAQKAQITAKNWNLA